MTDGVVGLVNTTTNGIQIFNMSQNSKLTSVINFSFFGNIDYSNVGGDPFQHQLRDPQGDPITRVNYEFGKDVKGFAETTTPMGGVLTIRINPQSFSFGGVNDLAFAIIHEPYHNNSRINSRVDDIFSGLTLSFLNDSGSASNVAKQYIVKSVIEELVLRSTIKQLDVANVSLHSGLGSWLNWPGLPGLVNNYSKVPVGIKGVEGKFTLRPSEIAELRAAISAIATKEFGLGSGLIDQIQKITKAAIAIADIKVWAQRS